MALHVNVQHFMAEVLGEEAASALRKAADRSDALSSVLGPRVIVGWLGVASRWSYDGAIPGMPETHFALMKAEDGSFWGSVTAEGETYKFRNVNLTHVASALSVALGINEPIAKSLKDSDIAALGQNIDLLIKTRVASLVKGEETSLENSDIGSELPDGTKVTKEMVKGGPKEAGAPGQQAVQKPPSGPVAPEAPKATQPMRSAKKPKLQAKLSLSQAETKCAVCEAPQFVGDVFKGCFCMRDLAKHAQATAAEGGYVVTFGPEWSKDDVAVFMDMVTTEGE